MTALTPLATRHQDLAYTTLLDSTRHLSPRVSPASQFLLMLLMPH
jgi:hypothetical protein